MIEPHDFLATVGQFATGVTVVTAVTGGVVHGMTANAFSSLSLSPMQVLLCVAKKAKMAALLTHGEPFTINMLHADQDQVSTHFAGVPLDSPPSVSFLRWPGGVRLQECLAAIGCTVAAKVEGGDHWIVTGDVVCTFRSEMHSEPLLYFRSKYARLEARRTEAPARLDLEEGTPMMFYDPW